MKTEIRSWISFNAISSVLPFAVAIQGEPGEPVSSSVSALKNRLLMHFRGFRARLAQSALLESLDMMEDLEYKEKLARSGKL